MFFDNPLAAFTVNIDHHYHKDKQYGQCYHVHGWQDPTTKSYLEGICVKRKYGIYYITSQGAG